jgi:hypothetical protein
MNLHLNPVRIPEAGSVRGSCCHLLHSYTMVCLIHYVADGVVEALPNVPCVALSSVARVIRASRKITMELRGQGLPPSEL